MFHEAVLLFDSLKDQLVDGHLGQLFEGHRDFVV